ncbi:hypothetical protein GCM10022225_14970 [Plantactinospora mayteni]|uniref:WD40 repeat domain-containing protein n=1 Tax=Plantactinospora mayteni TaxID=566021 RepID=A0ABQ4EH75_9ACTN|nr:hypothetical protein [Plantactinospora mayteni]GIG93572.1 hypothetical protein Pma05_01450 [Plantactinospora mayteni]
MTPRLAQALLDAAEVAPPVPSPDRLWRRGRLRRRRRRTGVVLACLLLITALAWTPVRSRTALEVSGAGQEVLPGSVAEPYLWQRTLAESPNGPVKLTFGTGHSLNLETALVLIGRDDTYRLDYLSPGEDGGTLSPDGRWLLGQNLRDLTTGETRKLDRKLTGHPPAVWAPDSRTAVGGIGGDGGIAYGPDGQPLDIPDGEIVLVDGTSGAIRKIATAVDGAPWRAAFSPDGSRLAFHTSLPDRGSMLTIIDTRTANPLHTVTLTERQRLAGPAAWTPDDSQILLAAGEVCAWAGYCTDQTWHLQRVDLTTGTIVDESVRGRPGNPTVIAWRDGQPVVQQAHGDRPCDTVALTETGAQPLPLTVAGHGCADYARDLLEEGILGGPGIEPSPWQAQWWAYVPVAVLLAGIALIAVRIRRRRRTPTPEYGLPAN